MRKSLLVLCVSSFSITVAAQEFWLEPDRFYFQPGEKASVMFRTGDDFVGTNGKIARGSVSRFEQHAGNNVINLEEVLESDSAHSLSVPLEAGGTQILIMESDPVFHEMEAESFTAYLTQEGLDDVLYQRRKAKASEDGASELYSSHTKLIVQSGSKDDETYRKVCGLPIEVIPVKNPLHLRKNDPVRFRILFEGKPLFGARVKVWNRYKNRISVQNIFSQQDGMIETHISNPGAWMVSVVKMVPSGDIHAQYRSYRGTLVFGIK